MLNSDTPQDVARLSIELVQATVIDCLCECGWFVVDGSALVQRPYATEVGRRDAHIYFQKWNGDYLNYALQGDYQSEGRNQLESLMTLIPKTADINRVREITLKFAAKANNAVYQTYAMKLKYRG